METLRLYKSEKLCSETAISQLFAPAAAEGLPERNSVMAYPWRAVWMVNNHRHHSCAQFLISVPKKRLRHAVDRVLMRRRMREAYRLSRQLLSEDSRLDIAFIYVGNQTAPYADCRRSVRKILSRICSQLSPKPQAGC